MRQLLVVLLLTGYAIGQQTYAPAIDAERYGTGSDGAAKIRSIIGNAAFCPTTGNNIGCTIDARGMTGTDLVFQSNPFHGPNIPVVLLLGAHTYVACVPWVSGQAGYSIIGVHAPSSIAIGTHIRAGRMAAPDSCPADFPGTGSPCVSCLNFTYQHGLYPASPPYYAALYNDCGDPTMDNPVNTADCFGGEVSHVQFDCSDSSGAPVSGCSFGYYTAASEERGGLHDVSIRNVATACGFWDRSTQIGPSFTGGGSGPAHFSLVDTTCTPNTAVDATADGWAVELNTTSITFSGQSGCLPTADPAASNVPTAYTTISGSPSFSPISPAIITNFGNCTTPPTTCVLNSIHPPGFSPATCTVTHSGSSISAVTFSGGMNYPSASVPAGGPLILRSTIVGQDPTHRLREAIAIEGDRDTIIEHVHTENVGNDTILHGFGTAPYSGGAFIAVNTTLGTGGCVHQGVGARSADYAMLDITREITSGCVIIDDNIVNPITSTAFSLNTTDTPPHTRVGVYSPSQNVITRVNTINPCALTGTGASPETIDCGNASSGAFSAAAAASSGSIIVKTTQVSATNQIHLFIGGAESVHLGVTCGTPVDGAHVTARAAGTSFTVTLPTFTVNPQCYTFDIENN